jgi:hypothetical protein
MTRGSEKRARNRHLTIRLTPGERSDIDQAAERAGLTAGSYARQTLLDAPPPRQVRRPPVERALLARLLGALGQVGNNLNQIAHTLNAGQPLDRHGLCEALAGLGVVRNAVLKALGREP